MRQVTECHICGQEIARYVCRKCGAHVGENCYNKEKGICERCMFQS